MWQWALELNPRGGSTLLGKRSERDGRNPRALPTWGVQVGAGALTLPRCSTVLGAKLVQEWDMDPGYNSPGVTMGAGTLNPGRCAIVLYRGWVREPCIPKGGCLSEVRRWTLGRPVRPGMPPFWGQAAFGNRAWPKGA